MKKSGLALRSTSTRASGSAATASGRKAARGGIGRGNDRWMAVSVTRVPRRHRLTAAAQHRALPGVERRLLQVFESDRYMAPDLEALTQLVLSGAIAAEAGLDAFAAWDRG